MMPGFYNHNYHILQTPGYVVILVEMIHDARIIPLDGRPHLDQRIRQWLGDSRGRWEGNTLVVDTTNFTDGVNDRGFTVFGTGRNGHLVERFTRVDADTIDYEFTVDDPTVFTRPWTAAVPMTKTDGPLFEYACHEGNYALPDILSGARAAGEGRRRSEQERIEVSHCRIASPRLAAYHLRLMRTYLSAALVLAGLLRVMPASAAIPEPVRIETGLVAGVAGSFSEVRVFKGLPFAAPPVGRLRWRPPQPPSSWDGVRAADTFSANCMQRAAGGGAFPPYGGDRSATAMSEDCLYLNIYTTAASPRDRRPVMVWIHGGALTSGAGAIYQGEELARKGVILVTINYRLGVFGFLAHPELTKESSTHGSGNYGFLDQIAALKWVQKNIAAFGGDASRVTIFGESAGSWSVHNLVATPLAKGLFQRAIGESGAQFAITRTLAVAEDAGVKFAEAAGARSLEALRGMPAEAVNSLTGFQTSATIDGWMFPQDVTTIFRTGKQNDVPVLIGSNSHEGSLFTPETTTGESFRAQSQRRYGPDTEEFLKLYPFTTDQEARAAQAASMRDQTFGWEMRTWARLQTQSGKSKVYLYTSATCLRCQTPHGSARSTAPRFPTPSTGRMDITAPRWRGPMPTESWPMKCRRYWVNFAATGDPNGRNLPKWAPYQRKDDLALDIGDSIVMIPVPGKADA